eukprot:COSAG01_NODE_2828_length_7002_cov_4.300014_4_plen_135_part_00
MLRVRLRPRALTPKSVVVVCCCRTDARVSARVGGWCQCQVSAHGLISRSDLCLGLIWDSGVGGSSKGSTLQLRHTSQSLWAGGWCQCQVSAHGLIGLGAAGTLPSSATTNFHLLKVNLRDWAHTVHRCAHLHSN